MKKSVLMLIIAALLLFVFLPGLSLGEEEPGSFAALSTTEMALRTGERKNLKLSFAGNIKKGSLAVEWYSSDESIATVNEKGAVTGISPGSAKINCSITSLSGAEQVLTCDVTVYVPVKNLRTEENSIQVIIGCPKKPVYTVEPENATAQTLEWTSQNDDIVIVDEDGQLIALCPGRTKVTAKTTDGSNRSLTWDVIVPSVYSEKESYEVLTPGSFQIPVVFSGENFDAGYKVEASGTEISYIYLINGNTAVFTVTPIAAGEAHLIITDRSNPSNKADIPIYISDDAFYNPEKLVITSAELVPGQKVLTYKFDLLNNSSIEIGEIGFLVDYRDQFGDTHYLISNNDGSIANHKYTTMFNILPGETKSIYGQNEAFRANDLIKEVRIAICYYRFLTGQKVYIPDSQLFWFSTKSGAMLRPEVHETYVQPDEDTMDRAARVNIGATTCELYSYVVKDFSRSKRPGIYLASITDGGNASAWGLQRGDVIYGADNILWADDPFVLNRALCDVYDGNAVTLKIIRNGEEKEITLAKKKE